DVQRARGLLEACPEALRGWEWNYVKRLCDDWLLTVRTAVVSGPDPFCLAFSPDGRLLATPSSQKPVGGKGNTWGEVRVWDIRTGREAVPSQGYKGPVPCGLAFSPDGKLLASGGWEGKPGGGYDPWAKVWEVATGREVFSVRGRDDAGGIFEAMAFSPDGRYLAAGSSNRTILCDARTGKAVRTTAGGGRGRAVSPHQRDPGA